MIPALVRKRASNLGDIQEISSSICDNDLLRVSALIDSGFDVNSELIGKNELNPIMHAIEQDRPEVVALLAASGANVNHVFSEQRTSLTCAIALRCAQCVKALLDGGADPNTPGKNGKLALYFALLHPGPDNQAMTHMLLQAGASLSAFKALEGQSAVDRCVELGHLHLLKIITSHDQGSDFNLTAYETSLKKAILVNRRIANGHVTATPNRTQSSLEIESHLRAFVDVTRADRAIEKLMAESVTKQKRATAPGKQCVP